MKVGDVASVSKTFGLYDRLIEVSKQHGIGTLGINEMLKVPVLHVTDYHESAHAGQVMWRKVQWVDRAKVYVKSVAYHPLILVPNNSISDDERRDQIVHELGHLVAMVGRAHTDHGDEWVQPTRALGGTAHIYHRLDGRLK